MQAFGANLWKSPARASACALIAVLLIGLLSPSVRAQDEPPAAAAPAPTEPAAPQAPAPVEATPPPQAPEPVPEASAPPPPPPPARSGDYGGRAGQQSNYDDQNNYDDRSDQDTDDYGGEPEKHEFSIRLDPFNWLLQGRLGLELEVGVWKFVSVELVPILVASQDPPAINFAGFDDSLTQHSNGIGPFSGASLGAGLWLSGEPFTGYVIRLIFTDYGYTYEARDPAGVFDRVSFTERRFVGFFGSHSRFGPFTLAGGFGLGYELNSQERCGLNNVTTSAGVDEIAGRHNNCNGKQLISIKRNLSEVADLNGSLHPVYLEARFSLGFVF